MEKVPQRQISVLRVSSAVTMALCSLELCLASFEVVTLLIPLCKQELA